MKKINFKILIIIFITGLILFRGSCTKGSCLISSLPPTWAATAFWKTEADATTALMGLYASVRPLFDRDY